MTSKAPASIQDRVRAGAALLDKERPGWRDQISPAELDISCSWRCVLGQLYGSYTTGLDALGLETPSDFGFACGGSLDACESPALTREWLELLKSG
jgi:hypothetical protein